MDSEMNVAPIPESMERFQEAWTKKHPGQLPGYCHNIYQLISEDKDGNVTNEMFAVNCMTNYGLERAYTTTNSFNHYIFIGRGKSIPKPDSPWLEEPISTTSATNSDTGIVFMGGRYHKDTGLMVVRHHILSGYFNYTTFAQDEEVFEIGIGSSATNLYYHARVYDENGNPSSFTKKLNERLTIKLYTASVCKIGDMINKAWNKTPRLYLLFTVYPFVKRYYSDYNNSVYVNYTGYNATEQHSGTSANGGLFVGSVASKYSDGVVTYKQSEVGSRLLSGSRGNITDIFVSNYYDTYLSARFYYEFYNSHFLLLITPKLETPEDIVCEEFYTNSYTTRSFSNMFVKYSSNTSYQSHGSLPVADLDIESMYMYNCQDHDWTIEEEFDNYPNTAYDCEYLRFSIWDHNYIEFLNESKWYRVYLNTRPDIPITAFGRTGYTLYATDEYWDTETWELIENLEAVPEKLRRKKYYCTFTDALPSDSTYEGYGHQQRTLPTTRDQKYHTLKTKWTSNTLYQYEWKPRLTTGNGNRNGKVIANDEYGYIASLEYLIYPDSTNNEELSSEGVALPWRHRLYGCDDDLVHNTLIWNTTKGDKIVTCGNSTYNTGFRVYTVDKDPTKEPSYVDLKFDEKFGSNCHWSYSDNGYVLASWITGTGNTNCVYVVSMYGNEESDTPTMKKYEGYHHAHAIDISNYFCGVKSDVTDHLSLDIVDMSTGEVYRTIDLAQGYEFQGMCGWKNWIYIRVSRSGVYSTFIYYIDQDVTSELQMNYSVMRIDNYSYYSHIQRAVDRVDNCESCMVMLASDRDTSNEYHLLFKESDPEHPIKLIEGSSSSSTDRTQRISSVYNQKAQLRYVNDNKQLLLAFSNNRKIIVDVGRILDKGTQEILYNYHYRYDSTSGDAPIVAIYKDSAILFMAYEAANNPDNDHKGYQHRPYFYRYPYETFLAHKMIGTTKTINSYHNPKQIGGIKNLRFQVTNDLSKNSPVD